MPFGETRAKIDFSMKMIRPPLLFLVTVVSAFLIAATPLPTAPADPAAEAARLNNLGVAYMNQQLFEKGLKSFEGAAKVDPKFAQARLNQGIALLNLQRVDPARELLLESAQSDPKDPHTWYNLGLLYKNNGESEKSAEAFRKVTEIDPNDADTWYFLGAVLSQSRQFPEAIKAFENALKLNPLHASAEFGLARAYQQSGDPAQGKQHLTRFQYVTQNKLGAPISLAYGEQGQYSRAEESPAAAEKVPDAIPVRFVDVSSKSGIVGKAPPPRADQSAVADLIGPGACFLDYDGDGKPDLFLPDNGPAGGMALYHNLGAGKFDDVTKKAGLDPGLHGISCTAGDYDNDGATDLVVSLGGQILLLHNEKDGKFKDVADTAGIKSDGLNLGVTLMDYDHDGDVDLYVTQYTGPSSQLDPTSGRLAAVTQMFGKNKMFRNNGNGTFTDVTTDLALARTGLPGIAAIGSDYDNDRAVDLIVAGSGRLQAVSAASASTVATFYRNPREGKFLEGGAVVSADGPLAPAAGIIALDYNHDGWMDFAFTHSGAPGVTLWRNETARHKNFERVQPPSLNWAHGYGLAALDYDNDGWIDLAAVGETADGKAEVRLFRNLGPDGFKDVTSEVGLDKIQLKSPRAIVTADYDGDGATDLLITQNHGSAILLRNEGGNKNHWLRLSLKGLNDNKSAIGTKVEVFAGANRQKWEVYGSSGYLGQNSLDIVVGLGTATQADVVRMLWPTGVLQDEIEVAGNRTQNYIEIDRRGSSCPTLFVWDGRHYELVGDMIGAGVIGHWVGPGQRNIPRPVEYVKIDRNVLRERDGKLSFRLMEPMEEVVYLDHVRLLAVDHPKDFDVYPNEYFASSPPYPEFKVVASRNAQTPAGVWDEHGHNLLPDLLARRYVGDFELLPFKGFTKPHTLTLDLGSPYNGGPLHLLLHGEIEYFTATGMYAADQAGIQGIAPYVEAEDAQGSWVRVIDDMGFPAGLPRTMTADLGGKLPVGTKRIRITTNLQIYWDSILVDRTPQNRPVTVTPVALQRGDLAFHGYPRQIEAQPPGNVKYVYEQVSTTGPYARQSGTYTRYGDVRPLLARADDRFVVFGSGEEVELEFDPASLPPLPPGWTRDYFFMANGFEKDMDFYAAEGDRVEPLPFHAMGVYPYAEKSYPLDDEHVRYLLEYNTRHVSGKEPRGYAYEFEATK
jgi:tetratricopeptide (TPR) repeat protein